MKKVIALALAMILTAGLSSVAFAATDVLPENLVLDSNVWYEDREGNLQVHGAEAGDIVAPGLTVYIPIKDSVDDSIVGADEKDVVKKVKGYAEWTVGKADGNPSIEFKKINGAYIYAVAVKMPANTSTKLADLNGSISLGKTKKDAKAQELNLRVGYDSVSDFAGGEVDEDKPITKFVKDAGEIEITWGDVAAFEVNASGQGNLNLNWNTKYNSDFAGKYDYANIDFVTFTAKPSFNRTGTLKIYTENEDSFIYEVTADGAKAISGAKYDASEGAWIFKTRTLGSYAVSDKELKATTSSSSSEAPAPSEGSSSEGTTGKPNPDTGR